MEYKLELSKMQKELALETLYTPAPLESLYVTSREVNRPGLELTGFLTYYEPSRVQVIGNMESYYLRSMPEDQRKVAIKNLLAANPPAVIFARGLYPTDTFAELAEKYQIPVFRSEDTTSNVIATLVAYLNVQLAPRITRHGVLVEVYGEGIFICGGSGVGKSETAIELVKRGHRIIADDAVEIRRVSSKTLVGSSPENIRHFSEIRGIGIINIATLFGMGAVKATEKIDFIVNLEPWNEEKQYDRMGLGNDYAELLGLKIPVLTIPVRQGRNLAVIIEVAAMNNRQKTSGDNAAVELMRKLGMDPELMAGEDRLIELEI